MDDISPDTIPADDDPARWTPRVSDGKMYCCASLGWVPPAVFFDHRWQTSRSPDDIDDALHDSYADSNAGGFRRTTTDT